MDTNIGHPHAAGSAGTPEADHVTIEVNRKPVRIAGHEATGLQIKQAAIDQGVHIQLDFVLSHRVDHRHEIVGDNERIRLHAGEEFHAIRPDDNS
jgi:hypothetical protein